MNSVELVKSICKERKIPISKLEKDLGFSNGDIAQLRKGTFPADRLSRIADYLGVPIIYLLGEEDSFPMTFCEDCGLQYNVLDTADVRRHNARHKKWSAAVDKFGFCWEYRKRENIKAEARAITGNDKSNEQDVVEAYIDEFKALFSRSLEASDYSLNHVDFATYVSMLLNQESWKKKISPDIYAVLVNRYGTCQGIESGSYYNVQKGAVAKKHTSMPLEFSTYSPTHKIPILGKISAGLPLYAEEHIEGYTYTEMNGGAEYFALRVSGDSMNAARILEGDLLIVRRQDIVDNGQIAVVMVDGSQATVKRFYQNGNTVTLVPQSTNPANQVQVYNIAETEIRVVGVVVKNEITF